MRLPKETKKLTIRGMAPLRQQLKKPSHRLVSQFLRQRKKLRILQPNRPTKFGSIDLLARDGRSLVIVEIKTQVSTQFDSIIEMISVKRREQLILLAHELMQLYRCSVARIDIITVNQAAAAPKLRHYKGVIEFHG
jgi:putative endonuclease